MSLFVLTDLDKTKRCAEMVISLRYREGSLIEDVLITRGTPELAGAHRVGRGGGLKAS